MIRRGKFCHESITPFSNNTVELCNLFRGIILPVLSNIKFLSNVFDGKTGTSWKFMVTSDKIKFRKKIYQIPTLFKVS